MLSNVPSVSPDECVGDGAWDSQKTTWVVVLLHGVAVPLHAAVGLLRGVVDLHDGAGVEA